MLRKYPDIMEEYLPCVLLSVEQGNVIQDTLLEQVIFRLQAEELQKAIQGLEGIQRFDAGSSYDYCYCRRSAV